MGEREKFGSRLGFIMVSAGCAIGLGNVWKFPYMCGQYGGAAFILIYLVFLVILGLPILISEFTVGRGSMLSVATAFDKLERPGTKWHNAKWFCMAGNYLLMMFYTMVAGWMLNYVGKMITGDLKGLDTDGVANSFSKMLDSPGSLTIWMVVAAVISFGICAIGLQKGVEKVTKVMMSCLIVLIVVLAIHSITLKGSLEGVKFYLVPDFHKLIDAGVGNVVFAALSQAFFTLSIGIGSMEIFGSYLKKERSLTGEAINIVCLDTFVAIMAGMIIIPACFAYGVEPNAGPPLLFITLPNVFNHMAGGQIWGILFFIFMSFAALSTVIAVFENIISFGIDLFHWSRKKSVIINMVAIIVLSMPAVLGFNVWSGFQPLGAGSGVMDLEDFIVSNNVLPLGSLIFILFCTSKNGWGWSNFLQEVDTGEGKKFPHKIRFYVSYLLPLLIAVIYLKGYYDMFKDDGTITLCCWMAVAVLCLVFVGYISLASGKKNKEKVNKNVA